MIKMQEKLPKELVNAVVQARRAREQFKNEITKHFVIDEEKKLTERDIEKIERYAFITELLTGLVEARDLAIIDDQLQIGDINYILEVLKEFGFSSEFLDELRKQ